MNDISGVCVIIFDGESKIEWILLYKQNNGS